MLQHAVVSALLLLVASCSGCVSHASDSSRFRSATFSDVTVQAGIAYRSAPQLDLDLYEPTGDSNPRRPALVWLHGGGFTGGDRVSSLLPFPTELARSGYVVASIDYRLAATNPCVAMVHLSDECRAAAAMASEDARDAVRWLRRNAAAEGVDADRIAIAGESAGAIVAAEVGSTPADPPSSVRAWISISGGLDGVTSVDRRAAPGLLFAGTNDPYIPYQWSVDTAGALQRAGVRATLVTLDAQGHVPVELLDRFVRESRAFLYEELDLH